MIIVPNRTFLIALAVYQVSLVEAGFVFKIPIVRPNKPAMLKCSKKIQLGIYCITQVNMIL